MHVVTSHMAHLHIVQYDDGGFNFKGIIQGAGFSGRLEARAYSELVVMLFYKYLHIQFELLNV